MKHFLSSKIFAVLAILVIGLIACINIENGDDVPSAILEVMKDKDPETLFKIFMVVFRKEYLFESEEGQKRFKAFKQSLANIKNYNEKYGHTTKFGITAFSDISEEEFYQSIENDQILIKKTLTEVIPYTVNDRFDPIDWRKSIPFRNRPGWGQDGSQHSSYALLFAYEAANALATKTYTALSAPQALNCIDVNRPYTYMNDKGLLSEKDYPTPEQWWNIKSKCLDSEKKGISYKISATAFTNLEGGPESPLIRRSSSDLYSFLKRGPVLVRISASWNKFQNYKGGIFISDEPCSTCRSCSRYFTALLVGYGTDSQTNTDYWILKFHKGNDWGENGSYMRLARNESGLNNGLTCYWEQPIA